MLRRHMLICLALLAASVFVGGRPARASMLVYDGTLQNVIDAFGNPGTSIDYYSFCVTAAGDVDIDIRSWEIDDGSATPTDLNGDGEFAFIDSWVFLFADDGTLDLADLIIDDNDDNFLSPLGFTDGSVSALDSFLRVSLLSGKYLVAVASFPIDPSDVIAGFDPIPDKGITFDSNGNFLGNDHGDYRLTISGNVAGVVPEPASCVLWGSFGLCICLPRLVRRIRRPVIV